MGQEGRSCWGNYLKSGGKRSYNCVTDYISATDPQNHGFIPTMSPSSNIRRHFRSLAVAAAVLVCFGPALLVAEDAKPAPAATTGGAEEKFIALLNNATLQGRWAPLKDGQLGAEKEDSYHIVSVQRLEGEKWQVNARLKYGGQDFDMPVPATVKFAGDTAILIVDNLSIANYRAYSAQLIFHGDAYAGTWSGGDHGGLMYGVVKH